MCEADYDRVIVDRGQAMDLLPGMLPPELQGLTIIAAQGDDAMDRMGIYTLHPHALPKSLTSLRCRGFSWERPADEVVWHDLELWIGWHLLPPGLKRLELDVVGTHPVWRWVWNRPGASCVTYASDEKRVVRFESVCTNGSAVDKGQGVTWPEGHTVC